MISSTTLVGVLPVPHPIIVRKYIPNMFTDAWFKTFLYGIIFLRHQHLSSVSYGVMAGAPIWPHANRIRMFTIAMPNFTPAQLAEQERQKAEWNQAKRMHEKQPSAQQHLQSNIVQQQLHHQSAGQLQHQQQHQQQFPTQMPVPLQPTAEVEESKENKSQQADREEAATDRTATSTEQENLSSEVAV